MHDAYRQGNESQSFYTQNTDTCVRQLNESPLVQVLVLAFWPKAITLIDTNLLVDLTPDNTF